MANNKGFFAVELESFFKALGLGMNEACLYLIYCCGSGKSNDKTRWSVNALTKYTNIATRKGKAASQSLLKAKLTKQLKRGKHPQFEIVKGDTEQVWLPNTFITGTGEETAPIERLRRTGDPLVMKLLLKLYSYCNIAEDGGIRTDVIYGKFKRKKIAEHQQFNLYGFNYGGTTIVYTDRLFDCFTENEKKDLRADYSGAPINEFWERFYLLEQLGLIYQIPTLFDSESGEPVVALFDPFTRDYCYDLELLNDQIPAEIIFRAKQENTYSLLIPKSYPSAVLKVVYVLRYRQHTALTSAGYAQTQERQNDYIKLLKSAKYPDLKPNEEFTAFA